MSDFDSTGATDSETSSIISATPNQIREAHYQELMTRIFSVHQSNRNRTHEDELVELLNDIISTQSPHSLQQIFNLFGFKGHRDPLVFWFAYYGYVKCLKIMYMNGENPNRRSNTSRGLTVLFYITSQKWKDLLTEPEALAVFTLLYGLQDPFGNAVVDINEIFGGETVLHRAIYQKKLGLVKFLLDNGAVMTIKNRYDETAENMGLNSDSASIKKIFLDHKFRVFYENIRLNQLTIDGLDQYTYDAHNQLCDQLLNFKKGCMDDSVNGELVFPSTFSAQGRATTYGLANQLSLEITKRFVQEGDTQESIVVRFTHPTTTATTVPMMRHVTVPVEWIISEGYVTVPEKEELFVNDTLQSLFISGRVYTLDEDTGDVVPASTGRLHSHTSAQDGKYIYDLIVQNKFVKTLEIGLAYGVSALYTLEAHRANAIGGHHTAIDPMQSAGWHNGGQAHIKRSGLESYFTLFEKPDWEALPVLLQDEGKATVDFIYIDGPHKFDDVMLDLFYCNKLLRAGGILFFDDLHLPSVRRVCSFIYYNMSFLYEPLLTPTFPATAAFKKIADEDERVWHHYSNF